MITSSSYYVGKIQIANTEASNAPNSHLFGNVDELKRFIERYEPDATIKCLGYSLDKEFRSNLEIVSPATVQTVKPAADQKWKDLFSGKEYQLDGETVYWRGLVFKNETLDRSLLADYVYSNFITKIAQHTGIGLQIEKGKNSKRANPSKEYVDAYSSFYNQVVDNGKTAKENSGIRSLYQFICDMNDIDDATYPNWMPHAFPALNIMSL